MDNTALLNSISAKIADCRRCSLWEGATNAVPGEGNPNSKIVFIGEGPGYNEDRLGRPFVGRAGKLLDKMLEKIGVLRSGVFITNVVKHRAPENRDPSPSEIGACKIWLDQQLEIIRPKVIMTLGKHSLERFIPGAKITLLHGKPTRSGSYVVLPMYHPAAALRNGNILEKLEEDFQNNASLIKEPDKVDLSTFDEEDDDNDQISLF